MHLRNARPVFPLVLALFLEILIVIGLTSFLCCFAIWPSELIFAVNKVDKSVETTSKHLAVAEPQNQNNELTDAKTPPQR